MADAVAATAENSLNDILKEVFFNKQAIILDVLPVQHVISELEKHGILSSNENIKLAGIVGEKDKCRKLMFLLNQSTNPNTFVHLFRAIKKCGQCARFVNEIQRELDELDAKIFGPADLDEVSPENYKASQACSSSDGQSHLPDTASKGASKDSTAKGPSPDVINIVVIGETGVGKSTWINALACYLTFETLDEAIRGKIVCPISTSFTMMDENYESKILEHVAERRQLAGNVQIEQYSDPSRSGTQCPNSYVFCSCDKRFSVRIIDTPGMGTTGGSHEGEDLKHIALMMDHISRLDKLHGIVFLQKSTENKLTQWFKYCMEQLMENLHRGSISNIFFCFTHSRSALYKPGETLTTLRALLSEIEGVQFQLNRQTLYCLDNECVKFLIAHKKGIKFSEEEVEQFRKSWTFSVDESKRLLTAITRLKPLDTEITVSVNAVRRAIERLLLPFAKVIEVLQANMTKIDEHRKRIADNETAEDCDLKLEQIRIETKKASPRTICTNRACNYASTITILGLAFPLYSRPCHDNCKMPTWLAREVRGSRFLSFCEAFNFGVQCKQCKCPRSDHMFVNYVHEYKIETKILVASDRDIDVDHIYEDIDNDDSDQNICPSDDTYLVPMPTSRSETHAMRRVEGQTQEYATLEDTIDRINIQLKNDKKQENLVKDREFQQSQRELERKKSALEALKRQNELECTKIVQTAAIFSCFLQKNAVSSGKDDFLDYLIGITSVGEIEGNSAASTTRSKCWRQIYLQELERVDKSANLYEKARYLTTAQVSELFDELCHLRHVGEYMISLSQALENYDDNHFNLEYTFNCRLPIGIERFFPSVYQFFGFK